MMVIYNYSFLHTPPPPSVSIMFSTQWALNKYLLKKSVSV